MDLKIELRKLFALHEASLRLQHGVRESKGLEWIEFAPTNFVYAFFTFNSIYSFDWESSFAEKKAMRWEPDANNKLPREEEQIKSYIQFISENLGAKASVLLCEKTNEMLAACDIDNASAVMADIKVSNSNKKLNNIAKAMPNHIKKLSKGDLAQQDFHATLFPMLKFVYAVRCNIFHGAKTHIEMTKPDQQRRLLVCYALLVSSNQLLFEIPKHKDIGWVTPKVNFSSNPSSNAFGYNHDVT